MANIPLERGYASLEKKQYYVTNLGEQVASNLDHYFPDIINVVFTKDMEERLDKITNDEEN
jgi:DNA topoisomerase-1